jgi:heterodisulfide reductase subunit D
MSKTKDKKIKLKMTHLTRVQRVELDACMLCGACVEVSPIFEEIGKESVTCRGKIQALKKFVKANYGIRASLFGPRPVKEKDVDDFVEALYSCTLCGACSAVCEAKISTPELWEAARADMVDSGKGPMPRQKAWPQLIKEKHNPYNQPPEDRVKWLTEGTSPQKAKEKERYQRDGGGVTEVEVPESQVLPEKFIVTAEAAGVPRGILVDRADVAYFVGCTSTYKVTNLAKATVRIIAKTGTKFTMLGTEEFCCGSPLIRTGQLDQVRALVKHNVEALAAKGVKTVVFSCSGCYRTALLDWPKYYGKLPFKLMHITQFVAEKIKEGKLKIKKSYKEVVTYHDPCHLGRHVGVFADPRFILESIPGLHLVEMKRNRMNARCCGAGGGVKAGIPELAMEMATTRLKEAQEAKASSPVRTAGDRAEEAVETGATTLCTACPFCYVNLTDGIKAKGLKLKMYDIVLLLDELLQ